MIEFSHVSFAYEPGKEVIRDLSFRLEDGESVGLIGANGAGKSTVMKLLLGLVQGEGEITADGIRLENKTLAEIRRKIGFVLQNSDNQMFMPTVYDDMMFAPMNYGMTREEAEKKGGRSPRTPGTDRPQKPLQPQAFRRGKENGSRCRYPGHGAGSRSDG